MYPVFAILSSSRGFLAASSVPFAASSSSSSCPFRPASELNLLTVVSFVFPSPRLLINVVMPPLLFSSFWPISQFHVTSIISPYLSGCHLSVLHCSYSCASSPHPSRQIFTPAKLSRCRASFPSSSKLVTSSLPTSPFHSLFIVFGSQSFDPSLQCTCARLPSTLSEG